MANHLDGIRSGDRILSRAEDFGVESIAANPGYTRILIVVAVDCSIR